MSNTLFILGLVVFFGGLLFPPLPLVGLLLIFFSLMTDEDAPK